MTTLTTVASDEQLGYVPYFVSALASNTIKNYKAKDNFILGMLDVFVHVTIWLVALIFEILVFTEADSLQSANVPDTRTWIFAAASITTFIVPAAIVILSIVVDIVSLMGMPSLKITSDNYFPSLTATIEGGLNASIILTLICMLYTVGIDGANGTWRGYTITLLVMKTLAASFINTNVRRALNKSS
jgi:hypothetical protein